MTKKEYIEIGRNNGLGARCPILNTCQRRAMSIYYFSFRGEIEVGGKGEPWENVLAKSGELSSDYHKNKIEFQGESPTIIAGARHLYFEHFCPEVCLFDNGHRPMALPESPCTCGDIDDERAGNKARIFEEGHYSECAEYSRYTHILLKSKIDQATKKKRPRIPQESKVRAELQKEINSICPFCDSVEVGHFEIHHIDENPFNNEYDNLILLCPTCHSKITKSDILQCDVRKMKTQLKK